MKQTILIFDLLITALLVLFGVAGRYNLSNHTNDLWIGGFSLLFLCIGIILSKNLFSKTIVVHSTSGTMDLKKLTEAGISKREAEILMLIGEGLSNQQIAGQLFISELTVKKHISNLFVKLNVERRTEAVKKAKELSALP